MCIRDSAIKWSIFDLKGRFFDENMIEFNVEHVGILIFGIQSCLARIAIFTPPVLGCIYNQNLLRQENTMKEAKVSFPVIDPASLYIYKGPSRVFNWKQFRVQTTVPEVLLFPVF